MIDYSKYDNVQVHEDCFPGVYAPQVLIEIRDYDKVEEYQDQFYPPGQSYPQYVQKRIVLKRQKYIVGTPKSNA